MLHIIGQLLLPLLNSVLNLGARTMNFAEDSPLNHSTQLTLFSINARMKKRKHITIVSRCAGVFSKLHIQEKKIHVKLPLDYSRKKRHSSGGNHQLTTMRYSTGVNFSNNKNASRWMKLAYKARAKYLIKCTKIWDLFSASSC